MRTNRRQRSLPREPQVFEIEKLSHEGRGMSRHEGRIVFIDGALPGETVKAEFTGGKSSFAEARTLEVLKAAPERVAPPCPHFHTCGGCSLQHLAGAAQLAFKETVLHERLAHAAGASDYVRLPAISGAGFGYRRKARLAVRYVARKERVLVGFRERHSNFITDMDSCAVLEPEVARLVPLLPTLIGNLHCREQLPQVEVAIGDAQPGGNSCALIFRHLQALDRHDLEQLLGFGQGHGIDIYLQPKGPESVHRILPTTGEDRLFYDLPDFKLRMAFHPTDFTQVNADINRQMVRRAIELLEVQGSDRVLDLFCGLGNFTLPLATRAAEVIGVEGAAAMVERGAENARRNHVVNARFLQADLTLPPDRHAWLKQGFDKVLLDPPRSGAFEVLPAVIAARPARIVYVSCNPATLARDAAFLAEQGYDLAAAGAMDMFPHTSHVEAMALFLPGGRKRR